MIILPWSHCKYPSSPIIAQLLYREWSRSLISDINHFVDEFNNRYQVKTRFDRKNDNVELDMTPEQMILLELTYTINDY